MLTAAKEIWYNRYIIKSQFLVNIKTTVASTKLGIIWWVLDPLLLMLIYTFVVVIVFDRGGPNYHIFALCGIVTFQSFSRSVSLSTTSLTKNDRLIKSVSLPMHLYILIPPVVQSFFYTIGLSIILVWNNQTIGFQMIALPILIILMILMGYTIGLFLSVIQVYFNDTEIFVKYILRLCFYLSPVLYSPDRIYNAVTIPELAKNLYPLNPMVVLISAVRDLLFFGKMFNVKSIFTISLVTLIFMQLGLLYFRRYSRNIPKNL